MSEIEKTSFDFYYGNEADQFSFYRIPKVLFTEKRFSKVSTEAKLLYGLLLDRMSLSSRNGWIDEENRVYIFFKVSDVMEFLGICKDKCLKLFAELDTKKGCGLICRIRQGLGKPGVIYVMNFNSVLKNDSCDETYVNHKNFDSVEQLSDCVENTDFTEVGKTDFTEVGKIDFRRYGKSTSGGQYFRL